MSKQTRVLVAKTHVMGIREGEDSMLQRWWTHGHSLSNQTQVLVANTYVLGMREREQVSMLQRCWTHGHSASKANTCLGHAREKSLCFRGVGRMVTVCQKLTQVLVAKTDVLGMRETSFYASEVNSMVKSDNRSCLMAIPVFFYKSRRLQNRG